MSKCFKYLIYINLNMVLMILYIHVMVLNKAGEENKIEF